jgi:hypothetical protein
MIERRVFIRHRVVRGYSFARTYSGRKRPNIKEECIGWYLFGFIPLFVTVLHATYLTDPEP